MKAALLKSWENMEICDMPKPVLENDEVLIKMFYAGVCGSDITVYSGKHPTATAPCIVGHEILGIIEEIKTDMPTDLKVGDRVTVNPLIGCGHCEPCRKGIHVCKDLKLLGIHENGGYAEYTKADIRKVVKISEGISDRIAALAEPFAVGYHVTMRAGVKLGDSVLIIGAGPIGMVLALSAKAAGAEKIIISEPEATRRSVADDFGFETINPMDYEDVMTKINELTDGNGFDIVYEVSGSKAGVLLTTKACKIRGTIVSMGLSGLEYPFPIGQISFKEQTLVGSRTYSEPNFIRGVRMLEKLDKEYDLSKLISDELTIDQSQEAIDMMINKTNNGKILIKCN